MQKAVLSFLAITLSLLSVAQSYVPFPTQGAYWRETQRDDTYCYAVQNQTFKDTLIDSMLYHRIVNISQRKTVFSGYCIGQPIITKTNYFIRNDTANRRVWFRGLGFMDHDSLLYDFNLSVGSTLPANMHALSHGGSHIVIDIQTQILGGVLRNLYYLSNPCDPEDQIPRAILIEGIGLNYGMFSFLDCFADRSYNLDCTVENGGTVYPSSTSGCDLIAGFNDVINNPILAKVFPNPTEGIIAITHHPSIKTIRLFDLKGEVIQEIDPMGRNVTTMHILQKQGIYIIQLQLENGDSGSLKIIKK